MAGAGENGGWSPDDLPDLPEEWGVIVIPDDLSELDDEVRQIRAELRLTGPLTFWQRLARRPGMRRVRGIGSAVLRAPVLIITLAVLVTVASLFASAWPGPPRQSAVHRPSGAATARSTTLPALELFNAAGQPVPLNAQLPAVILLIDGCPDCGRLVTDTIARVRPEIAVITVSAAQAASTAARTLTTGGNTPATGAAPQPQGKTVYHLRTAVGSARGELNLPEADTTAAVLLVDATGEIIRTVARTASVNDFSGDLARL